MKTLRIYSLNFPVYHTAESARTSFFEKNQIATYDRFMSYLKKIVKTNEWVEILRPTRHSLLIVLFVFNNNTTLKFINNLFGSKIQQIITPTY